jgi:L-seryl-tRNA(Ser) seleniumtransferase
VAARLSEHGIDAAAVPSRARVGGGGAPEFPLPSAAVSLPAAFAEPLRLGSPPVVGHVEGDRTMLDLRSLPPASDELLSAAVLEVARRWT